MRLRRGRDGSARLVSLRRPIETVIGRDDERGAELLGEIAIVAEDLIDAGEVSSWNRRVFRREEMARDVGTLKIDDREIRRILPDPTLR